MVKWKHTAITSDLYDELEKQRQRLAKLGLPSSKKHAYYVAMEKIRKGQLSENQIKELFRKLYSEGKI